MIAPLVPLQLGVHGVLLPAGIDLLAILAGLAAAAGMATSVPDHKS